MKTVLACAGHLDDLMDQLEPVYFELLQPYDEILIATASATQVTQARFERLPKSHLRIVPADASRRHAVMTASLERNATHIHYADLDHILRWWQNNPDEATRVATQVRSCDCLLIGRSSAAMRNVPAALRDSEAIINTVFSHVLGHSTDTGGGNRGFSRQVAAHVLEHDRWGHPLSCDSVWPVLAQRAGFQVETVFVDGLAWSGNDVLEDQAAQVMREAYDSLPEHWRMRVQLANQIIRDGLEALLPARES
jgi:hypothetical protein